MLQLVEHILDLIRLRDAGKRGHRILKVMTAQVTVQLQQVSVQGGVTAFPRHRQQRWLLSALFFQALAGCWRLLLFSCLGDIVDGGVGKVDDNVGDFRRPIPQIQQLGGLR